MPTRLSLSLVALAAALASVSRSLDAQRRPGGGGGFGGACSFAFDEDNYFMHPLNGGTPKYDGRIVFARIQYSGGFQCHDEGPGWSHDYPRSESNFMHIMQEITSVRPFLQQGKVVGGVVVRLDQPEIFKYPVAYLSEPGGWHMSPAEVKGLRQYIARGGFIIFDDMGQNGRPDDQNLFAEWQRAFPGAKPIELPPTHPVFNAFFKVDLNKIPAFYSRGSLGVYYGFFQDNDPKKRLLAVIDDWNDIGEYIEFSSEGMNPTPANESYKLWVNYYVYALTH